MHSQPAPPQLFFSSPPLASLARPPARHPHGGGLSFAVLQAALHPRSALPPPRRVGLRFPTPVGHGRGLASRPGCAVPGKGVGLPWLHLATSGVRRYFSAPPASARLRPASPTPGERGNRRSVPASPRQPAAARHRSRLSLSASGSALPNQAGLLQANIAAISIGVNRSGFAEPDHASVFIAPRSLPSAAATA